MNSGRDVVLDRRWVVECETDDGDLAVVLTATDATEAEQCNVPVSRDLPHQNECDPVVETYAAICGPGAGPVSGTKGAIAAWFAGAQLTTDASGRVLAGQAIELWVARCLDDGTWDLMLIDDPVDFERTTDDEAHVLIGGRFRAGEAEFTARYCPL